MAEDVAGMIAAVKDETHWPSETTAIIRHLVASLRHYRRRRFWFSEKTGTFNTVAGQSDYVRTTNYPADLMEIDSMRVESGTGEIVLERISLPDMRAMQSGASATRNSPIYYSWHGDTLIFFPTPGGVWTVNFDYLFDSTRDSATGNEIDGTTTTYTNEYFKRGAELLRTRIIYALSLGRAQDPTLALSMQTLNREADQALTFETHQRKIGSGFEVARCF